MDSEAYSVILGNEWIMQVNAKIDFYQKKLFYQEEKDALLKRTQEIIDNNDAYEIQQRIKIQQAKKKQKNESEKFKTKLEAKWIGPYFIHEVYEKSNYKLRTLEGKLLKNSVYGNRLKMYYEETLEL
ncbi:5079_t:CDS:2 [Funneliformis geosporum]|nr:5079_t:CDS:2 [Funneliformis geosporum]